LRHGLIHVSDDERSRIELLLDGTDSSITYRSRYLTSLQSNLTIDLLLIDDANPRSVAFQLERLTEHVGRLPGSGRASRPRESRRLIDALSGIRESELDSLSRVVGGKRQGLAELLSRLQGDLSGLADDLSREYLTHSELSRQ
jgi:uncharacterized alpha-E superfamily protein